jgi:signal transduction histidine kinase
VVYANRRAQRALQPPDQDCDMEGRPLHELVGADHAACDWLQPGARSQRLLSTSTGAMFHTRAEPLEGATGEPCGWVLCLRPADEGDQQDELRERARQARHAERERFQNERAELVHRLVDAVSHELRNPLGTIHASLYALAERMRESRTPVDDVLQRVQRSIRRCNGLVEQLTEFCRTPALVTSTTRLDEWLDRLGPQLAPHGRVRLDLQSQATVALDRRRVRRMLQALYANACQAGGPDGAIDLRTRCKQGCACIIVEDEGPGMDEETMRYALEPLYSTRPNSLGLGLPLAAKVARRHGGRLSIDTSQGKGTRVTVSLPLDSREETT